MGAAPTTGSTELVDSAILVSYAAPMGVPSDAVYPSTSVTTTECTNSDVSAVWLSYRGCTTPLSHTGP